jgi:hypothetical protein
LEVVARSQVLSACRAVCGGMPRPEKPWAPPVRSLPCASDSFLSLSLPCAQASMRPRLDSLSLTCAQASMRPPGFDAPPPRLRPGVRDSLGFTGIVAPSPSGATCSGFDAPPPRLRPGVRDSLGVTRIVAPLPLRSDLQRRHPGDGRHVDTVMWWRGRRANPRQNGVWC